MASYGALLLRLILGVVYIMHAYLALVVLGPAGMIDYQAKNGSPLPRDRRVVPDPGPRAGRDLASRSGSSRAGRPWSMCPSCWARSCSYT